MKKVDLLKFRGTYSVESECHGTQSTGVELKLMRSLNEVEPLESEVMVKTEVVV